MRNQIFSTWERWRPAGEEPRISTRRRAKCVPATCPKRNPRPLAPAKALLIVLVLSLGTPFIPQQCAAQDSCPASPGCIAQYKTAFSSLSKCGNYNELTHPDLPRVHRYHEMIDAENYHRQFDHSGTSSVTNYGNLYCNEVLSGTITYSPGPWTDTYNERRTPVVHSRYNGPACTGPIDCVTTGWVTGSWTLTTVLENDRRATWHACDDSDHCTDYSRVTEDRTLTPFLDGVTWKWAGTDHAVNISSICGSGSTNGTDITTNFVGDAIVVEPDLDSNATLTNQTSTHQDWAVASSDPDVTWTYTVDLTDEYTDAELRNKILCRMPDYGDWFTPDMYDSLLDTSAYSAINGNHIDGGIWPSTGQAELQKMSFRFVIPGSDAELTYHITYDLITYHTSSGAVTSQPGSCDIGGTGDPVTPAYSDSRDVAPPDWDDSNVDIGGMVITWVDNVQVSSHPKRQGPIPGAGPYAGSLFVGTGGCQTCGNNARSFGMNERWGGFAAEFSMGTSFLGFPAGNLRIQAIQPDLTLATPAALSYAGNDPATVVVANAGQLRQIKSPQALADIVTNNAFSYEIRFYLATDVGGTNGAGIYQTNGPAPFVIWKLENPDASTSTYNRIRITETRGGTVTTNESAYTAATGLWTIGYPGLRQESLSMALATQIADVDEPAFIRSAVPGAPYTNSYRRTITNIISAPGGSAQMKVRRVFQSFYWGEALVEETLNPETNPQTTTLTYYRTANTPYWAFHPGGTRMPLMEVIHPDGSWEFYENYNDLGLKVDVCSGLGDEPPPGTGETPEHSNCRHTHYTYSSEVDFSAWGDNGTLWTNRPRIITEKLKDNTTSVRYFVPSPGQTLDILAATPSSAVDDPNNLVTTTIYFTNGPNLYRIQSIGNPDGTMSIYNYTNSVDGYQTNTVSTGQPNGDKNAIIDGTTTVTVLGPLGETLSRITTDIVSSYALSSETYDYHTEDLGRPWRVTFLDGTHEDTSYACCYIDSTTDRDGVTTQFGYDAAKRQITSARLSITTSNTLDAAGRVLKTTRFGTDGSPVVTSQSAYDLAGQLIRETNALSGVTTYTNIVDGSGHFISTNTYPDGGTRIEIHYVDGSLQKVIGTAVHGVRYVSDYDGTYGPYTAEIKLDAGGNDTMERTTNYTDFLGRPYKTVYASASGTPSSISYYNNKGQLTNEVDPDGVSTLYQFNAKGELEYTIIDTNQDHVIDWTGPDRITRLSNDVVTAHGVNVRRTQTFTYPDGSSTPLLLSKTESSTDGLQSWQTVYRDANTPVVSSNRTVYAGSGNRYQTNTAPDGSCTVSAFQNGRLVSTKRFDSPSLNSQLSALNYSYDYHGRQSQITDARNGTTAYTFNPADLVATATTPSPGPLGGSAQSTVTYHNQMLQATNVIQPDGGSVISEFFLTGELKRTHGARTYPVEYTYDYAGRMATMKTWKSYAGNSGTAVTTWLYDGYRGWLTNKVYADGHGPSYDYTAAGRLKTRLWARGIWTTNIYNNAGEISEIDYSSGATPCVAYSYDRRGRQVSIAQLSTPGSSPFSTTSLNYNDANELLSESYSGGNLSGLSVTNGYDQFLRRTNVAALNGSTAFSTTVYGYDGATRLNSVTNGNYNALYSYVANSPLVSQITLRSNSTTRMTTTKQFDFLNRLTQISSAYSASSVVSFSYQYNQANQRTMCRLADGSMWLYSYDSLGQLTSAKKFWSDWTPVAGQQFEYSFDDIGNRTQTKAGGDEHGANFRTANYSANSLNQYTSKDVPSAVDVMGLELATNTVTVNGNAPYRKGEYFRKEVSVDNSSSAAWQSINVSAPNETAVNGYQFVPKNTETFVYDLDGNLTSDGRWTYTWDAENRLTSVQSPSSAPTASKREVFWAFDGQGRRIRQATYDGSSGSYVLTEDIKFLSDGWRHIAELNASDNSVLRTYVWGLDLSGSLDGAGGIGDLLMIKSTANGPHFYAYDGNGNVSTLVSATNGAASSVYEYDPFGGVLRSTGFMAGENPFQFSTKRADKTTDCELYEYRVRRTDLAWLSRDAVSEAGGLNLYAVLDNQAVSRVDALGLKDMCCVQRGPIAMYEWGDQQPTWHKHRFSIWVWLKKDDTLEAGECRCNHKMCDFRQLVKGHDIINGSPVNPPLRSSGSGLPITDDAFVDDGFTWRDDQAGDDDPFFIAIDEPQTRGLQSGDRVDYYLEFIAQVLDRGSGNAVVAQKSGYWIRAAGSYQRTLSHGGFDVDLSKKK